MKKLILALSFFFLIINIYAQGKIFWSEPIDLAASNYGNHYPRIILNDDQTLVTWGGGNEIYMVSQNQNVFSNPILLNENTPAFLANWTGAEMAARGDTIYVCFMHKDWGEKTYLVRSFDGGANFSGPFMIEDYTNHASRFPSVAIQKDGNPIVTIMKMGTNGSEPHYVIRKSKNFGESFEEGDEIGGFSGPNSEACDCCPASIKIDNENIVVFYRDNLNNIRDVWATLSVDNGESFSKGFAVDNNNWQVFSCPASGPDGIFIEDQLYTVFFSGSESYISSANVVTESLDEVSQLGDLGTIGSQNYPRIDNHENKAAIVWKGVSGNANLMISYTEDITSGQEMLHDTIYKSSFRSADVAISDNAIHVVWEDSGSGTVKYVKGNYLLSETNVTQNIDLKIFPNPTNDFLLVNSIDNYSSYKIYNNSGQLIKEGILKEKINVRDLAIGSYVLELISTRNKTQKAFIKN